MSHFIVSMDFGGLSERPPESNVMPLPTNATVRVASGCVYDRRTRRGGRTDPMPDADEPAVAAVLERRLVEDLHRDAGRGGLLRRGRERGGRQVERRGVDQVPHQVDGLGDHLAAAHRVGVAVDWSAR